MPKAASLKALSYGATDQGPRPNNEDEFWNDDERGIYFVIDGMGGYAAGEQAAAIAKIRLKGRLERAGGSPEQRIREAITLANNAIFETAASRPEWQGMACVLTVAVLEGDRMTIGHVGDSRLYVIEPDGMRKITKDHSPVGQLEDSQQITEAEAMSHKRRNEVFRDVGSSMHDADDPDFIAIYTIPFHSDMAVLLCSDGLSDILPEAAMHSIIMDSGEAGGRVAIVNGLIRAAVEEAKDNVTAVFVHANGLARTSLEVPVARPASAAIESSFTLPAARPGKFKSIAMIAGGLVAGALLTLGAEYLMGVAPFRPAAATVIGPAATTIRVSASNGKPAPIQSAIDAAKPGDVVEVGEGIYADPIVLRSGITLLGFNATLRTSRIAISSDGADQVKVAGFRILSDPAANLGTGVSIHNGSVDLERIDVSGAHEAGIEYSGTAIGQIQDCIVHGNGGPGVLIREQAAPVLSRNLVFFNGYGSAAPFPGLSLHTSGAFSLVGNEIFDNAGGAIWTDRKLSGEVLTGNHFGPNGKTGRASDIRIVAR